MDRRKLLASAAGLAAAAAARRAAAQPAGEAARIGWLTAQREESLAPYLGVFRAALAEAGHVEGRNLEVEYRFGDDDLERVPALAAELVRLRVALIVGQGTAVRVLGSLGLPVPVVYSLSGDPVAAGLAESLSRPRGGMTGVTLMAAEVNAKRLEILRDLVPGLRRVALVGNPDHAGDHLERLVSEEAAGRLGVALKGFRTRTAAELDAALAAITADPPGAISLLPDGFATQNRGRVIDFALGRRLPLIAGWPVFAQGGALCSYGARLAESYRRLAHYVDRILKGARPADLPVERPTSFELVVNLHTARAIGVAVPLDLLARADQVIE